MKTLLTVLFAFFALNAHASLGQEDVLALMTGQWSIKIDSGSEVKFVVRSNAEVMVVSTAHRENVKAKLTFAHSTSSWGMDGLPVAHLILTTASDEEAQDFHLLLTGLQLGAEVQLKKLAAFTTFNDGPNEYSEVENGARFKKYNARTQQWSVLP